MFLAQRQQALYRKLQAFRVPSVHKRFTSKVHPSSKNLLTGRPTIATPTTLPSTAAATENLCPVTGLWCLWYLFTNSFASFKLTGTSINLLIFFPFLLLTFSF